jgi:hypothetical protein
MTETYPNHADALLIEQHGSNKLHQLQDPLIILKRAITYTLPSANTHTQSKTANTHENP